MAEEGGEAAAARSVPPPAHEGDGDGDGAVESGGDDAAKTRQQQQQQQETAAAAAVDDSSSTISYKDEVEGPHASTVARSASPADMGANTPPIANAALHAQMLLAQRDSASAPPSLPNSAPASVPSSPPHHASLIDDDELARLKSQIKELTSQVTSLNGKLVQSYNRVGGLEDDLHGRGVEVKDLQGKVEKLEAERKTWEERYEGGLLVEKASHSGCRWSDLSASNVGLFNTYSCRTTYKRNCHA